jgi:hypothetical protein
MDELQAIEPLLPLAISKQNILLQRSSSQLFPEDLYAYWHETIPPFT